MKRSRHRWLGLTLFCITLTLLATELPSTSALKATSLIFSKTSSTTEAAEEETTAEDASQAEITAEGEENNSTRKITGIPQIDYLTDPNLPRELNGYNLSEYPFYATVPKPELLDFKCDGLHDGFYASVAHKCQVYHHCLFGTRYDFLCANYTAFDQRTFICQFVSEVDCKNSPDFWGRNDALYIAASTEPPPTPPTTTTTTTTTQRPRPIRRRPYYAYDYYDDDYYDGRRDDYDYEDRRRPRPRPGGRGGAKKRPVEDYDDDGYERRRPATARGRPGKRTQYDRRPYDEDEDRRPGYRSGSRRSRPRDDEEDKYEDDRLNARDTGRDTGRDSSRDSSRDDRDDRDDIRPRRPIEDARDDVRPKRPTDDDRRDDLRPKRPVDDDRRDDLRPKRPIDDDRRDDVRSKRPLDDDRRDNVRAKRPYDDDVRPLKRPVDDEVRPLKRPTNDEPKVKKLADDGTDELRPLRPVNYNKPRKEFRPRNERPVVVDDELDDTEVRVRDRDEIRPRDKVRPRDEIRPRDETRSSVIDDEETVTEPRQHNFRSRNERKPYNREVDGPRLRGEDRYQSKGRRSEDRSTREDTGRDDRPRPFRERNYDDDRIEMKEVTTAAAGLVKPIGHGIFGQPRMPPKIKRPVPVNAKDKFEYIPAVTTKAPKLYDDEYEDYDEEDTRRPSSSGKSSSVQQRPNLEPIEKEKFKPTRAHLGNKSNRKPIDYDDEYYDEAPVVKQKVKDVINRSKNPDDYYYDNDDKQERRKHRDSIETKVKGVRTNVRVVKRPFLPSRGGSLYLPRGLQPVAGRDMTEPVNTTPRITSTSTTPEPITNPPTTTIATTRHTTKYTTTTKPTTTITTQQTTTDIKPGEEYEYYDEEDIDYDKKQSTTPAIEATEKAETTTYVRTTKAPKTTITTTPKPVTTEVTTRDPAKYLATKVLRVYNENYEAIKDKLESTLAPGDYVKPYLATSKPAQEFKPKVQPNPEISKPYTATGKPLIPDVPIKQNLADSIESDYDFRINEALAPKYSPRVPTGFSMPDRDYTFSRYRNIPDPQFAASDITSFQVRKRQHIPSVSIRTPNSYYIQPQRVVFDDSTNRYPRQLLYRPEYF